MLIGATGLLWFGSSVPAAAQEPGHFELSGAYAHAVVRHEFDWANYQGWTVEERTYVRPQIAITGVGDALYWTWTARIRHWSVSFRADMGFSAV